MSLDRARTAGNAAYVPATPGEIQEVQAVKPNSAHPYPATCLQRGYEEWPTLAIGFVDAAQAKTRLDGTNLLMGGCNQGTCQSQFGNLGGDWVKAKTEMCLDPRDSIPFVREQHLCAQTIWDKKNKESCCDGTISTRAKCAPGWCPMSKGCKDSQAMIKHYSKATRADGKSALMTEEGRQWCLDAPGSCDVAKLNFCASNPTAKECKCILPQRQADYTELMETMNRFGIPPPSSAYHCWYKGCQGTDGITLLKTQAILKGQNECPGGNLTVCNQIIDIQEGAQNAVISGVGFNSVCTGTLPKHKSADGPKKAGGESIDGSSADHTDDSPVSVSDDDDAGAGASNGFLLAVGAVGLLAVIMLIVMMFKA